jgi:Xaa-Pro aminopeptidase
MAQLGEKGLISYNYEGSDHATLRYLTGFTGEGALVVTADAAILLTDSRYAEQANRETTDLRIVECRDWQGQSAADVLKELSLDRVAFASRRSTVHWRDSLAAKGDFELVPLPDPVAGLRAIKSAQECGSLEKAARIAEEALAQLLREIRLGMNEADVALRLEWLMREAGSEGSAFEINASVAENTALNHYNPVLQPRKLETGDLLLLDFGACVDGYRCDITRTFSVGKATDRAREIYNVVLAANEAGIAAVRSGATGEEVDRAARDVINAAGFGDRFGHGLGHGIGLEVHERPGLAPRNTEPLATGMVTTVEPGIYIPGFGGVRIEDDVLVTEGGCRVLTSFPKEALVEVGT